jgi:hypothetical protein
MKIKPSETTLYVSYNLLHKETNFKIKTVKQQMLQWPGYRYQHIGDFILMTFTWHEFMFCAILNSNMQIKLR